MNKILKTKIIIVAVLIILVFIIPTDSRIHNYFSWLNDWDYPIRSFIILAGILFLTTEK